MTENLPSCWKEAPWIKRTSPHNPFGSLGGFPLVSLAKALEETDLGGMVGQP